MLGQQDAGGQALVLAQSGRHVADETNAARNLVVDDFGRNRNQLTDVPLAAGTNFGLHPECEIVCVAFGNHRVDFESCQVDDGHDRGVPCDSVFLFDEQVADDAADG